MFGGIRFVDLFSSLSVYFGLSLTEINFAMITRKTKQTTYSIFFSVKCLWLNYYEKIMILLFRCSDKDECKEGEDNCNKQIETCVNTIGSYRCDCKYGLKKVNNVCVGQLSSHSIFRNLLLRSKKLPRKNSETHAIYWGY